MARALFSERFFLNMQRINRLVELVVPGKDTTPVGGDVVRADLCRAIVVFLHATFEDTLRTVARQRIGEGRAAALDRIPLAGNVSEKFALGALHAHRGKTVDQVIQESVGDHLARESFGSSDAVEAVLRLMELDTRPFKWRYSALERMMRRRHRIVHNADLPSASDTVVPTWTIGDDFEMSVWLLSVVVFHLQLRVSVNPSDEVGRWFLTKRSEALKLLEESRTEFAQTPSEPAALVSAAEKFVDRLKQFRVLLTGPSDDEFRAIVEKLGIQVPTDWPGLEASASGSAEGSVA